MPLEVALVTVRAPFAYQVIATRAAPLKQLGMSASAIARRLGVTDKTVAKALRFATIAAGGSSSPRPGSPPRTN
jgi:predicted transcriptional regulator